MAEKQRLGRDVFIALAAIGWADGKLDAEEADAIVRTALEEGLELDEIESIEEATKQPIDVGAIDLERLTKEDRLFVYAVASWMTRLDGTTDAKEIEALDRLAKSLKLPDGPRRGADAIAQEIGLMAEGDRPARYDLPQLRKVIAQRLEVAERRRAAARDQ